MMFTPAALRTVSRRVIAPTARRTFSSSSNVAGAVAKNSDGARKAFLATAGAAIAFATYQQQQEVCVHRCVPYM